MSVVLARFFFAYRHRLPQPHITAMAVPTHALPFPTVSIELDHFRVPEIFPPLNGSHSVFSPFIPVVPSPFP